MVNLTRAEYVEALERMKSSPRDRIAMLAEWGVTIIAGAGGALAAGVFLAKTVTILGIVVVLAATPIGWVVAAGLIAALVVHLLVRKIRRGGKLDAMKGRNIQELEERIRRLEAESKWTLRREPKMQRLITSLQLLVANDHMSPDMSTMLIAAVENQRTSIAEGFSQIQRLIAQKAGSQPRHRTSNLA